MRLDLRTARGGVLAVIVIAIAALLIWRFVRPLHVFTVSEAFERPIRIAPLPAAVTSQSAYACAACHVEIHEEWATSIHSQAWTDPYFQVDWRFDGSPQICKNCHIPLEDQQEHKVLGFRDKEKWDPILAPNPSFDAALQREGVTCAACHVREGRILGTGHGGASPHGSHRIEDPNQICFRCHVVTGERWDTFFRLPPCGTVPEMELAGVEKIDCISCHMPEVERALVPGGPVRATRRHLWRGGHDPQMVRSALRAEFVAEPVHKGRRRYTLTLTNVGALHFLPTGTPDRHLTVRLRVLDAAGGVLKEEEHRLKRVVLWRPFIVDLWDTRLPYGLPRTYIIEFSASDASAVTVEAVVRYHLLDEARRRRIGYENPEPIAYEVFRERRAVPDSAKG